MYRRQPMCFVRGKGTKLYDKDGKEYLDLLSGIAVCGLGHAHPAVTQAIQEQAAQLIHCSNLFVNEWQPRLAEKLAELTGMERTFFCNSGAEANECAIKIARKFGRQKGIQAPEIISIEGAFHGRTLGSLSATPTESYQAAFRPLVPGFVTVPRNDPQALANAITLNTSAVMLEAIQGESGVFELDKSFLEGIRDLCDRHSLLLIADEIQCGMHRTGDFLAIPARPDVVTLAKGLANGLPIGACLAAGKAAETLQPGDHGSTFGGNPLVCRVAITVLEESAKLASQVLDVGAYLKGALVGLPGVAEVRGKGLMLGIGLEEPVAKAALSFLLDAGFVVSSVGESTLRLLPPLLLTRQECDLFVSALERALQTLAPKEVLA